VRPQNRLHPCRFAVLLVMFPLLSGCGGTLLVEGTVTFDGEPVSEGSISFEAPEGAGPTFGGRIEKGAYRNAKYQHTRRLPHVALHLDDQSPVHRGVHGLQQPCGHHVRPESTYRRRERGSV
jgi:hypothetical protein